MHSVSFILDGSSVDKSDIAKLSTQSHHLASQGIECEFIAYRDNNPQQFKPGVSVISSTKPGITSFEKAIASASGSIIILTTAKNVLADKAGQMCSQATAIKDFHVAIPVKQRNKLTRLSGVRRLESIPYIFVSKGFAVANSKLLESPEKMIRKADKQLALIFLDPLDVKFKDILVLRLTFSRPYVALARNYIRITRIKYKAYRKRRRDEKLSRRVLSAPYNSDIPVFIICRDRVEPLKKLVKWCEEERLTNIYFVDNASTYPPLLEYFSQTPYEVIRLRANIGHTSPWQAGIVDIYAKDRPYIVTDPDIIPSSNAHGAVKLFADLLNKYAVRRKVGFGLRIDNLPDHYDLKKHVISWEKKFWISEVEDNVFDAEIDTTFALYRPLTPYVLGPSLRTGGRFVAEHEPWYTDSTHPSDEIQYYRDHADRAIGSWGTDASEMPSYLFQ